MKKLGNIVRWLIGIFIILIGLMFLLDNAVASTGLWIAAGLLVLPPITRKIPQFKGRIPALILGCIILLIVGIVTLPPVAPTAQSSTPPWAQNKADVSDNPDISSQDIPQEEPVNTDNGLDAETTEELKRWIRGSVTVTTGDVNATKADIKKWGKIPEQDFSPVWESVVLEHLSSQEQYIGSADIASDMVHFNSVAAYLNGVTELYESLYSSNEKIASIKQFAKELSEIVSENQELQKKYPFNLTTAYITCETFYITQRLETSYSDNILGALQKEFASYQAQSTSDWVAYDVEYVLGTAMPGDTFRVIHADSLNPFTQTGAYEVYYVDTGTTTETVDQKGFRNTVPVLQLISNPESINTDQQAYSSNHDKCIVILNSLKGLLGAEDSNSSQTNQKESGTPAEVSSSTGFVGTWKDSTGTYQAEISGADSAYTIDVSQQLSDSEWRRWSLEGYVEGNGIFYSGVYVDLYLRDDGTAGGGGAPSDAAGVIFLTDDGVLHWDSDTGELETAVLFTRN